MTREAFLANEGNAQEKLFDHRMGLILQQTGNPRDAASVWFTGRKLSEGGANASDINKMTGARYADAVTGTKGRPRRDGSAAA